MDGARSTKADAAHWTLWLIGGVVASAIGLAIGDSQGADNPLSAIVRTVGGIAILVAVVGLLGVLFRISRSD